METEEKETENKRIISYETGSGTLIEGWTYIPGSEWWQTEYPVKSSDDFPAALEYVNARNFVLDSKESMKRRPTQVRIDQKNALLKLCKG